MTWRENNPDHEHAQIAVLAVIPKAALVTGGVAMQRELCELLREWNISELIEDALFAIEIRARNAMERVVAEQNARRVALGLPPLVPAKPGEEPPPAPPQAEMGSGIKAAPPSPYRGRSRRKPRDDAPAPEQPRSADASGSGGSEPPSENGDGTPEVRRPEDEGSAGSDPAAEAGRAPGALGAQQPGRAAQGA